LFLDLFLDEILKLDTIWEHRALKDAEKLSSKEAEVLELKLKLKQMEVELENQKRLTRHFEGMSVILSSEFKKAKWVEARERGVKLSSYFREFNSEMKGFLLEKKMILERLVKIEKIVSAINVILK
jgi:hypothetical protein